MNYYNEIRNELINNEITKRIKDYSKNKSDLSTYYKVGKLLSEAGKCYGEGIIKNYSERLSTDLIKKADLYGINIQLNDRFILPDFIIDTKNNEFISPNVKIKMR